MFAPKDFDKVSNSGYMKFQDGSNKVRFMGEPVTGYTYWVDDAGKVVQKGKLSGKGGKPIRAETFEGFDMVARTNMSPFAAAVVWNYAINKIQILEIKQKAVIAGLDGLAESKSWGDITGYDIIIKRTKTGSEARDVDYSVIPEPKAKVPQEALEAYEAVDINLKALYSGADPWKGGGEVEDNSEPTISNVDIDVDDVLGIKDFPGSVEV